ncbi:MAK10-like protein [Tanacetum coccineum]
MKTDDGIYLFKFSTKSGMEQVLERGPWIIRNSPLILSKWTPNVCLKKGKVNKLPLWVKMYNVPVLAYSGDGLSLIATQIGKPLMLDAFTSSMCVESWGRINFARALIEINADSVLKTEVVMAIPMDEGDGYTRETIKVEYEWNPPHCVDCKIFGHVRTQCPKQDMGAATSGPNMAARNDDNVEHTDDGFTEVTRKKNKGANADQRSKSRLIDGDECGVSSSKGTASEHKSYICNEDSESDNEVDEVIFPEGDKLGDKIDIQLKGRHLMCDDHEAGKLWLDDALCYLPLLDLNNLSLQQSKEFLDSTLLAGSISTWDRSYTEFPREGRQKNSARYPDVHKHHGRISIRRWTRFKELTLQKIPSLWHRSLASKSWAILEDLTLYDNESWNDPRDFAKPVKAIALPQDVLSTSDRRLIELETQVQRLMEAHLASTQPTQACVNYTSSRVNRMGSKRFTPNQEPRSFNDAANTWKEKPNFNWEHTQTFTSPKGESVSIHSSSYQTKFKKALLDFGSNQEKSLSHLRTQLEQQKDDMIGKINLLWKTVSEKLNNVSTPENARILMTPKSIAAINHDEREELRNKGIKSSSEFLSLKYLSPASINELNKNPSAPKRVHFVNSIVILSTDNDTDEGDTSSTNAHKHELNDIVKRSNEIMEQGKEDDEMETDMEVNEVIEEVEKLSYHEWLLEHPRPPWVRAKVRAESPNNIKISCMIDHIFKRHAYIDLESPINIMSRRQYNQIMTYGLRSREEPSKPNKISNFVGRVKCIKVFIGSLAYECDFMVLEDTSSIIDRHLGEMVFGKPFIDKTSLVYDEEKGTVMFKQGDEKITFKMPYTMETFKQARLMGLSADSIPLFRS